jgi:hypothetical protein
MEPIALLPFCSICLMFLSVERQFSLVLQSGGMTRHSRLSPVELQGTVFSSLYSSPSVHHDFLPELQSHCTVTQHSLQPQCILNKTSPICTKETSCSAVLLTDPFQTIGSLISSCIMPCCPGQDHNPRWCSFSLTSPRRASNGSLQCGCGMDQSPLNISSYPQASHRL